MSKAKKKRSPPPISGGEFLGTLMPGWSRVQMDADLEKYWARDWTLAVVAYEVSPRDFYAAYHFLELHPANQRRVFNGRSIPPESYFEENHRIMVVKVDPKTGRIETKKNGKGKHPEDAKRNTATRVWIEWGPWCDAEDIPSHDPRADTGGKTYEKAIVNLAHNVYALYGAAAKVADTAKLDNKDRW